MTWHFALTIMTHTRSS